MNPKANSTHVTISQRCHPSPRPVSPEAVVKYLVQNGPLTHVAEILKCVDGYASELRQESFTMESLGTAIDTERVVMNSIDELLRECQGIYSTVRKRMKEAENVVNTRSQDLRGVIAQLRSTPFTTPPRPSLGIAGPSVAQMSTKVEEVGMTQTEILNALQGSGDKLKVALDKISSQRKSMQVLLGTSVRQAHRPPSPCAEHAVPIAHTGTPPAFQLYDSLWERYQRGSQEFQSGIDKIVKNGETIRDLALFLEGTRDLGPTVAPLAGNLPTLAEELSACQMQNTDTAAVPPSIPHNKSSHWRLSAACFELLKVWPECLIKKHDRGLSLIRTEGLVSSYILVQLLSLATFLVILFVFVNIMRARYFPGPDPGQGILRAVNLSSIRDILLGDKANMPDELIYNLIPKR